MLPRARLGPKPSEFAGSLVSDEKWTFAPGSHWVRRCCRPLARLFALRTKDEMVPAAGFAPAPPRSQRGMLTVTICRVFEMGPSVGFAPTCACLQDRCLSKSATKTWNGALTRICRSCGWAISAPYLMICALSRTALHRDPPPSHGGVHDSYTLRASMECGRVVRFECRRLVGSP